MQTPESQITMEVARFIEQMTFEELPVEVLRLG